MPKRPQPGHVKWPFDAHTAEIIEKSFRTLFQDSLNSLTLVTPDFGGTGLSLYVVGDMIYADGVISIARLAAVATGNALISGGVGVAPAWGKIGLTTHVSGTLPVANGGTGIATLATGSLALGAGTSPFTALAPTGVNYFLRGTGATTWGNSGYSLPGNISVSGGGIWYVNAPGTAVVVLPAVATGNALISAGIGVAPAWDKIGLTVHVTGVLPVANGGTGTATQLNIRKTGDESVTNDQVHQADDHLTVSLAASSAYAFEIHGHWTTAAATAGISVQLDGTVGVSSLKADVIHYGHAGDDFTIERITAFNAPVGVAGTGDNSFVIKGTIETSTAGTFFLEWAQNTADAGDATTLQENSTLILHKLNA